MNDQKKQQLMVWWVLWFAFQVGIFVIYHFIGGSARHPSPGVGTDSPAWLAAFAPAVLSVIVRWVVLPRLTNPVTALPIFVAGIAMAETTCFLGLFIFPIHQKELFMVSAFCIFQMMPIYARNYFKDGDGNGSGH